MRLGELLLQRGVIDSEQLEAALHEQRRFGGRLGTNLVQLGYVEVDTIARALSTQRHFPPLLSAHLASIDTRLLALFPAQVLTAHKAVPIGYTQTKPARVVVACMDPTTIPVEELAFAAGTRIEVWIAPEALMQQCLERFFGVAPTQNRYMSVKLDTRDPASLGSLRLPHAEEAPAQAAMLTPADPIPPPRAKVATTRMLSPPPPPPSHAEPAFSREPASSHVELTASHVELATESAGESPSGQEAWDTDLGHDLAPPEARPVTAPPEALRPVIDRAQASMLIEMATSKDQIGRVLVDWLRSTFGCGLVLVIRGDMAIGWRGFFPDAEDLIEAVAIPLGKPSMFSVAYESREPFCGRPPEEGAKIQERFWKLLRCAPPTEALVFPVVLGKRTANLVYAHMEDGSALEEGAADDACAIAQDAAAAYARLIGRDRKKK